MDTLILISLLALAALILVVLIRSWRDAPDRQALARLATRDADYQQAQRQLEEQSRALTELQQENARLKAELEHEKRSAAEKIQTLTDAEKRLQTAFENLANRIFEDKGRALTEQHQQRLSGLLQPLKEQLESFRNRVDEVHKQETEQSARLLEQVRQLQELSGKVSEEANQLAQAIKGDSKRQGDWGEIIVERIFEASGLEAGREYETQSSHVDEEGRRKRPDFVVNLPGDKAVIVDSKVSLTAYERYMSATDQAARDTALAEHVRSVRRHVTDLHQKDYTSLLGNQTLDFVILCIPLEPAYQAAMQADPELMYDVAKTNVVITGPTTLMITLKLIAQIWRRENENRNAEKIADRAGRLYDQVALVAETLVDARKKLDGVSDSFDLAIKRLKDGRGNLIGRVEELRKLGAKVNKQLPAAMLDDADEDDETPPND